MSAVQSLARQLNGLHPQIDKEYQPANCEYPWKNPSAEDIIAPVDHNFNIDLNQRVVVTILKEVRARAEELRHWEYE